MTVETESPNESPVVQGRLRRALAFVRRMPFMIAFTIVFFVIGIVTTTLWSPAREMPWFGQVATGLPSFAENRWWTVFTSPFFADPSFAYLTLLPLIVGGIGWAEWRFGTLRTIGLVLAGHIVGVLGAAGLLALLTPVDWAWSDRLAQTLDVGPSCGALTALVFAIATLPSPWRLRARIAVGLWAAISVLYLGQLYDLEHAIAIAAALIVSGLLPAFRHPEGRPSEREWRLIAFSGLIAIGAIQIIDLVIPYSGPLGDNEPVFSLLDVAIDVVVILLIANGVRLGHRVAWFFTVILGLFNVVLTVLTSALMPVLLSVDQISSPWQVLGLQLAPTILWIAMLVVMFVARGAFRVHIRPSRRHLSSTPVSVDEVRDTLHRTGGGTLSWMATWSANSHIKASGGVIAYQAHSGVAILLGDPIVPAGAERQALGEYATAAQRAGYIPCAFSSSEAVRKAMPDGWRSIVVAEDTLVDLPGLEFKGKAWGAVRTAINRAAREGVEFRMVRLADEPWSVRAQVRAISEQWTGDKGLPEMRFTLGTVDDAMDPEVAVGIAVDADGSLHGVTSWLPVYGPDGVVEGWTLDLMRRRDGGFGPVMEFLIGASAQHFSEAGHAYISLSGAPLVRTDDTEANAIYSVLDRIAELIEPLYGFRSLHKFKQKFNPRAEPMHLLYRDEGDLPRIGIALTRAYLPDASLHDLVVSAAPALRR
ncbi:bifunctional lysylphosphatidylglycerol flippase/synthetase MprF [Microbacterium sp.]|uniref:bifunctional lysylphosphatidylglycerol flippase/synthetase MprF n=1 Tax=Microbacterium sp. TaxID=51671 RepID=UPI003F99CDC0